MNFEDDFNTNVKHGYIFDPASPSAYLQKLQKRILDSCQAKKIHSYEVRSNGFGVSHNQLN